MIDTNISNEQSKQIVEYYKALCTFPYAEHPLFKETNITKYHYFKLLQDFSLTNGKFINNKLEVNSFYRQFFNVNSENETKTANNDEHQLICGVRKLRYKLKKYSIRYYTYKYLFFTHYLLLRHGLITEEDSFVKDIFQRKRLKINKKDALLIINFTNSLKSGDLKSPKLLIKNKKFEYLDFFYQSFENHYLYQETKEKRFLVMGTMSAGKSTFLNSILGKDLFPSQNEACTSKVYKYINRPFINHFITTKNGEDSFTCLFDLKEKDLHVWNEDTSLEWLQIEGSLSNINPINKRVTFIDTPGTNNSMNRSHHDITISALQSNKFDTILYLMNATQLGTDDDKQLISKVREYLSDHPEKAIVFVVNKVDEIDESAGESIAEFAKNTENYLKMNGFKNPKIQFVSALAAKLSQMVLEEQPLTRKERNMFHFYYEYLSNSEADLTRYSNLDCNILLDTNQKGQITVQDKLYEISRIFKIIHHSGIHQITHLF
jgi:small GTP-binding protein